MTALRGRWHPSTAIVGFKPDQHNFDVQYVTNHLSSAPGFRGVHRTYRLTRAALINVRPDELDVFIKVVSMFDLVEYCENNSHVTPASFNSAVPEPYAGSGYSNSLIQSIHRTTANPFCGTGTRIAMIDSGLAPHPFLPRLSFSEVVELETFFERMDAIDRQEILDLAKYEKGQPSPLAVARAVSGSYFAKCSGAIDKICRNLRSAWQKDLDTWWKNVWTQRLMTNAGAAPAVAARLPDIRPVDAIDLLGCLRKISPQSYNFVADTTNVEDRHGHGTQMAGLLSARSPLELSILDPVSQRIMQRFEPGILGIVPEAELLVLKCFDADFFDESNVDAMILALEHVDRIGATLIYIGLTVDGDALATVKGAQFRAAMALDRTAAALASKITVVCPAGNRGKSGLDFPGTATGVVTVTSLASDPSVHPRLSVESSWAAKRETVSFCAFGGDMEQRVLTTSVDFGYQAVHGTSVAAVVVAGLLAKAMSETWKRTGDDEYQKLVKQAFYTGAQPNLRSYKGGARVSVNTLLQAARTAARPLQSAELFGAGAIIDFTI